MNKRKLIAVLGSGNLEIKKVCAAITPTSTEIIEYGALDDWLSDTDSVGWSDGVSGTSTVNKESTVVRSGFAARLDIDASNNAAYISRTTTTSAGSYYQLSAWMKNSTTGKTAAHFLANISGLVRTLTDTYTQYIDVIRPAINNGNQLINRSSAASSSIYIDDVSLKEITFASMLSYLGKRVRLDGYYRCRPTVTAGTQAGLVVGYADANNFIMVYIDRRDGKAYLDTKIAGTWANVINGAITYTAEKVLHVAINGTTVQLFYDGTQVGTDQTIVVSSFGKAVYGFSSYSANTVGLVTTSNF